MRPFEPLFKNPHLLTILGNFWPRRYDWRPFPTVDRLYQTEPTTQVLVQTQLPVETPRAELVLVHGLEGSGDAGYIRSMAWTALQRGFAVHRFHMRTCGDTAHLCKTLYHGGLTHDLQSFLEQRRNQAGERPTPVYLAGFSLGGNIVLKLAGELGATELIQGVCGISVPIDLALSSRRINERGNRLYLQRFMKRMRARILTTGRYTAEQVAVPRTLWEIDDQITAPSFGFGSAAEYYRTQSSAQFLERIRVPALLIHAKDDPLVPWSMFQNEVFATNPCLTLVATEHGGHIGFLSRRSPRFWADGVVLDFFEGLGTPRENLRCETSTRSIAS